MTRVYLIGAGFSKAWELPLASQLTEFVLGPDKYDDRPTRPDLWEYYVDCIRHLVPSCGTGANYPPFEPLISELGRSIQLGRLQPRFTVPPPPDAALDHLKTCLLMRLRIRLMQETNRALRGDLSLLERFIDLVDECESVIVSFNWDVLIEAACESQEKTFVYGYEDPTGLRMYKPHGSLNLVETTLEEFSEATNSRNVHELVTEWAQDDILVLRARNAWDSANRVLYPFRNPIFVEPVENKCFGSPWIETQWKGAESALAVADEVFIIGYALSPSDSRSRNLLGKTIGTQNPRTTRRIQRIVLIDRNATQLADRYKGAVGRDIEIVSRPWEESWDALEE